MKLAETTDKNELADKIEKSLQWSSRYELDLYLMQAGYSPEQIDIAWQQVQRRVPKRKRQLFMPFIQKCLASLAIIWVLGSCYFLINVRVKIGIPLAMLCAINALLSIGTVVWLIKWYAPRHSLGMLQAAVLSIVTALMTLLGIGFGFATLINLIYLKG